MAPVAAATLLIALMAACDGRERERETSGGDDAGDDLRDNLHRRPTIRSGREGSRSAHDGAGLSPLAAGSARSPSAATTGSSEREAMRERERERVGERAEGAHERRCVAESAAARWGKVANHTAQACAGHGGSSLLPCAHASSSADCRLAFSARYLARPRAQARSAIPVDFDGLLLSMPLEDLGGGHDTVNDPMNEEDKIRLSCLLPPSIKNESRIGCDIF